MLLFLLYKYIYISHGLPILTALPHFDILLWPHLDRHPAEALPALLPGAPGRRRRVFHGADGRVEADGVDAIVAQEEKGAKPELGLGAGPAKTMGKVGQKSAMKRHGHGTERKKDTHFKNLTFPCYCGPMTTSTLW